MRILFVCHRLPYPPRGGAKIRPFNVIRHLSGQGHEVTVASLARSEAEEREGEGLGEHCTRAIVERVSLPAALLRMAARLPTAAPSAMGYFWSPALAQRIHEALDRTRFDLVFVHCAFVAPYVARISGPRKILDFGDMDSQKWLAYAAAKPFPVSLGYRLEGFKLQRAEARLAECFDLCTCITRAEMDTLRSYRPQVPTAWFPNGVDVDHFQPTEQPYQPDSIVFIGRMDYYPNQECMVDFCRNVLPEIRRRRPGATLAIVGADPSRTILKLGRLPGVTVTGSVPDVRPHVVRAAVSVAPLRIARGTQNKILEAMAMGVPVVASTTAARGVDAEPGDHLLTASGPEEYTAAITRLLTDPAERQRLAQAGRGRVLSHHRWEASMQTLDRLIDECMTSSSSSATGASATRPATGLPGGATA